jgi:adenylosuccinate synthase
VSVLGISMGDEGKGRVVHEILDDVEKTTLSPVSGVMKVNGGANAGHTAAGLKLNLLPSGVGNSKVKDLLVGAGVVADPRKFLWEALPLEKRGLSVLSRLKIDEKCQVSDLTHRLLDLAWENYRVKQLGKESRGSTGRGISPAYCDETGQWQIFYQSFLEDREIFREDLSGRLQRAVDTIKYVCKVTEEDWFGFFETLTIAETRANQESLNENIFSDKEFNFEIFSTNKPFDVNFEILEETYWDAGQKLSDCIVDIRCNVLSKLNDKRTVVVEFGQAYWLDKRHGFTPNVTASHTFSGEIFQSAGIPLTAVSQVGCCKAYDTKVGTHHFITHINPENNQLGKKLSQMEFGTSTGRQRMVGWFDAVEKGNALRYGGFEWLVINKLDALSALDGEFKELKICVAYKDPDGNRITTVPRSEKKRKSLLPIYEILPAWNEDISKCENFDDLPEAAKNYVKVMARSICEVAYGEELKRNVLPNLLFLGVGPNPGQIIQDLPSLSEII